MLAADTPEMPAKQCFPKVKSEHVFWPGTETNNNVMGGSVRPRFHTRSADPSDAEPGYAGVCHLTRLDDCPARFCEVGTRLLEAARRREIDVVLVWRLDRWGRSVTDLLTTLQELEHLGVGFVSLGDYHQPSTILLSYIPSRTEILGNEPGLSAHPRENGNVVGRQPAVHLEIEAHISELQIQILSVQ